MYACWYVCASDCPKNIAVTPILSPKIPVNTTLTCSSISGEPSPSYYWLNGSTVVEVGDMVTVSELGPFFLTCVANYSINGSYCVNTLNVSGTAVLGLLNVFMRFVKRIGP